MARNIDDQPARFAGARQHASPARFESLEGRRLFSVITVDDDRAQIQNAQFTKIQQAVNFAKKGDTIRVAPGRYTTAVVISGPAKDNLTIYSSVNKGATIDPPNGTGTAVKIDGAKGVTLRNFVINGPSLQVGVTVSNNGGATIVGNRIKSVRNNPFDGVATGFGITVSSGNATIQDNAIYDYQKAGIVIDGASSRATVRGNTVTGHGSTALLAQVGIQFSNGAAGAIDHNAIRANVFSGGSTAGAGILIQKAHAVSVTNNTADGNDENIDVEHTVNTTITGNTAINGTFDGIVLFAVRGAIVRSNSAHDNQLDGIFLDADSSGNTLTSNVLASDGQFDAEDLSSGSGTGGTANTWSGNTIGTKSPSGLA